MCALLSSSPNSSQLLLVVATASSLLNHIIPLKNKIMQQNNVNLSGIKKMGGTPII